MNGKQKVRISKKDLFTLRVMVLFSRSVPDSPYAAEIKNVPPEMLTKYNEKVLHATIDAISIEYGFKPIKPPKRKSPL